MWKVRAYTLDGKFEQPRYVQSSQEVVTAERVAKRVDELFPDGAPLQHFIQTERASSPLPGRDAIDVWGEKLNDAIKTVGGDWGKSIQYQDRALFWNHDGITVAWHDATLVVVRIDRNYSRLDFEYEVEGEDIGRKIDLEKHCGPSTTYIEWRGYFGTNSYVVDGVKRLAPRAEKILAATLTIAGTGAGFLVGMVFNHIRRHPAHLRADPTFPLRLRHYEKSSIGSAIAKDNPELRNVPGTINSDICVIFVHGTMSCCLVGLADLSDVKCLKGQTYRYEHDTFKPIYDNGRELAELIRKKVASRNVLLLCHSRGGLVGKSAAWFLRQQEARKIVLWTYGTPHMGTPLVDIGSKMLGLLYRLGATFVQGIPVLDYFSAAFGYYLLPESLPPGITDMLPDSSYLKLLNSSQGRRLRAYGGRIDINSCKTGFMLGFDRGFAANAFGGEANDLIVPTASAMNSDYLSFSSHRALGVHHDESAILLGAEPSNVQVESTHFDYFKHERVRNEICEYFREVANQSDLSKVPVPGSPEAKRCDLPVEDEFM